MLNVLRASWALYAGILMLMMGNALQGAVVGVRAEIENFDSEVFGFVSAAYFAGLILGAKITPTLLKRVGHVRVFAALASLISAAFVIYAAIVDPIAWFICRLIVGTGFAGVYIVSESWINDRSDNTTRGSALGVYMLVQFGGVVAGQAMLNLGDPAGFELFVLMSVLVSVSFAPILLSVQPAPVFETAKPMTLRQLFESSPLGSIGSLLLGGAMSAMFGMSALYAKRLGLSVAEISIFLSAFYAGALVLQYPLGWMSDRMDRRTLIVAAAAVSAAAAFMAVAIGEVEFGRIGQIRILGLQLVALIVGGLANPLYGLLIAHTNDYVEKDQMAAAAGGLLFMNGVGAALGPIATGYMLEYMGPAAFWYYVGGALLSLATYGLYRMTQRPSVAVEESAPYAPVTSRMGAVGMEMTQELVIEKIEAAEEDAETETEAETEAGSEVPAEPSTEPTAAR